MGIGSRVRGTSGCSGSSCRRIVRIRRGWIIPLGLILRSGGRGLVRRILIRVGAALGDVGRGSFVATGGTGSHGTATSVGHWKTRIWPVERRTVGTHGLRRARTAGAAGSCRRGIGRVRRKRGRTGSLLVSVVGSDLGGDSGTSGRRCRTHVTLRLLWKLLWLLLLLLMLSRNWSRRRNVAVGRQRRRPTGMTSYLVLLLTMMGLRLLLMVIVG